MTKKIFLENYPSLPEITKMNSSLTRVSLKPESVIRQGREYSLIGDNAKFLSSSERALGIFLGILMTFSVVGLLALLDKNTRTFTLDAFYNLRHRIKTYVNNKAPEADLCTQMFLAIRNNDIAALPAQLQKEPDAIFQIDDHFVSPFSASVLMAAKAGRLNNRWPFVDELLKIGQLKDFDNNKWLNWFTLLLIDSENEHQGLLDNLIDIENPELLTPRILSTLAMTQKWDLLNKLIDMVPSEYLDQSLNYDNFFNDTYFQKAFTTKAFAKGVVLGKTHPLLFTNPELITPLRMAIWFQEWPLVNKMLLLCPNVKLDVYALLGAVNGDQWQLLLNILTQCPAFEVGPHDQHDLLYKACEAKQWDVVDIMLSRFPDAVTGNRKTVMTSDGYAEKHSESFLRLALDNDLLSKRDSQVRYETIMHLMMRGAILSPNCSNGAKAVYEEISGRLQNLFHRIALLYSDQREDLEGNTIAILPNDLQHKLVDNMVALYCPELKSIPVDLVLEKALAYFKLQGIATSENNAKIELALETKNL